MGTPARPVAVAAGQLGAAGVGNLRGWTLRETGGTNAATVRIFDGTSAAGTLLATVALAAGESAVFLADSGIRSDKGLFCAFGGTGVVEGSVFVG